MVDGKENAIKEIMKLDERLKRKRPFSDSKLTIEEFNRKYWLNGNCPYQYHTMSIEDGTNEREQLMINDIRSLKNAATNDRRWNAERMQQMHVECKKETAHIKKGLKVIAATCAVQFGVSAIITISHIRHCLQKNRNRK